MQSGCTSKTGKPATTDSPPRFDRTSAARYYRFMAKARFHYNIMLRPEPEGGYTALVPALPGCVTYGRTVDEAREMAKDAISGYIASLRKHKDPIPTDDNTLVASLDLEYAEATRR